MNIYMSMSWFNINNWLLFWTTFDLILYYINQLGCVCDRILRFAVGALIGCFHAAFACSLCSSADSFVESFFTICSIVVVRSQNEHIKKIRKIELGYLIKYFIVFLTLNIYSDKFERKKSKFIQTLKKRELVFFFLYFQNTSKHYKSKTIYPF